MGVQTILGQKIDQSQKFLEDGTRIPVATLWVRGNVVVAVKTNDKDHYSAIQLGFGQKKKANKSQMGQIKGANLKAAPKFLREVKMDGDLPSVGQVISALEVFKPGDIVNVTGVSKGKGYAGVVKRHHFKGGPRTHGQSDRERAPGSIGQTTTPGRVYKGKRMAGRMGHETVTIRNLEVVDVSEDTMLVKGLVPGGKNTLIMLKKVSENKKFVPLYKDAEEIESTERLTHVAGAARSTSSKDQSDTSSLSESRLPEFGEKPKEGVESTFSSPANDQPSSSSEQAGQVSDSGAENKENKKDKKEVKKDAK